MKQLEFESSTEFFSDSKRIKQIIINLVANALKFTFTGAVTIKASIKSVREPEEDMSVIYEGSSSLSKMPSVEEVLRELVVEVTDTGVGIGQRDIENLFKNFGKLKAS